MLEYVTLGILCIGLTLVFYTFIFIHDLPYVIAKKRDHPQAEAIHVACWLSLFTLHALWPLVFLWAVAKRAPIGIEIAGAQPTAELENRVANLEAQLGELTAKLSPAGGGNGDG